METKTFLILDIVLGLTALIFTFYCAVRPKKSALLAVTLPLAIILVWFLIQAFYFFSITVDDSFISLKYAKNFYSGYGLTFNIDTNYPVEGYSNFLWILLITPFFSLGGDILLWVKCISLFLSIISLLLTYLLARKYCGSAIAMLAPLFLVSFPQFALWTVGGLETPLYIFLILLGFLLLSEVISRESPVNRPSPIIKKNPLFLNGFLRFLSLVIVFLAIALCRFEGIILLFTAAVLLLYNYFSQKPSHPYRLSSVLLFSFIVLLSYAIYYFWRTEFYHSLLPNMFYAKVHFEISSLIHRVTDKLELLYLISPFVVLSLLKRGQSPVKRAYHITILTIVLFALSFLAYCEWMVGFRYALPALPFLIILAVRGLSNLITTDNSRYLQRAFIIALLLVTIPQTSLFGLIQTKKVYIKAEQTHQDIVDWLNHHASSEETLALWDMGLIPYYTTLKHYYDIHLEGLLESHTNQFGYSAEYFLNQKPDYILLMSMDKNPSQDSLAVNEVCRLFSMQDKFWNNYSPVYSVEYTENRFFVLFKLTP
jgi:hypothetical protein